MRNVLLDENIPYGLARALLGHSVRHVRDTDWPGLANGRLIAVAEAAGYDVLVTADRNMRYQQNWTGRSLALIVLSTNNWAVIRRNVPVIAAAIERAEPGGWREVVCEG